ncbi:MAG: hypothetical protein O3B87_01070 [bacterium]|nr:hypothetical protein [bacterium]
MILVNKPVSLSPLQAIVALKVMKPELKDTIIGYAGRLDPMAEGLLLLLTGDENKARKEYELLDKEYKFEVLLGIKTDSYDILGLIDNVNNKKLAMSDLKLEIPHLFKSLEGQQNQPYPPYSAARVKGKPLYYWAREGKIDEVAIPSKQITIQDLRLDKVEEVRLTDLKAAIIQRISDVKGEFRQHEIIERWNEVISKQGDHIFTKLICTIECSSGTYVRSIANELGTQLGTGAIAYSIKRIRIGTYKLGDAINFK